MGVGMEGGKWRRMMKTQGGWLEWTGELNRWWSVRWVVHNRMRMIAFKVFDD